MPLEAPRKPLRSFRCRAKYWPDGDGTAMRFSAALSPTDAGMPPGTAPRADASGAQDRRFIIAILLIAAAARWPFVWHGFGAHPDEWLVIRSGLDFWLHGTYSLSRVPGYPFDELLMGGLAWLGGAPLCGLAATAASLVVLVCLRRLAPYYGVRSPFWMVLAFSFQPWIWSSAIHAMDYIWSTGALIAALYYVERREYALAGLACAVGFGFRPTSLLWIAPLFLYVVIRERHWRAVLRFAAWAAIPALIPAAMILSMLATQPGQFADVSGYYVNTASHSSQFLIDASALAVYHLLELLGFPALIVFIVGCFFARPGLLRPLRTRDTRLWIHALICLCLLPTYWLNSGKPEYMLPALPGLFLIGGRCISDRFWKWLTAAFVAGAFVTIGLGHSSHMGSATRLRLQVAGPSLRPGVLLWYRGKEAADNRQIANVGAALSQKGQIVQARSPESELDPFYVSSLLRAGPPGQARIQCPLIPAVVSFPPGAGPELRKSDGLPAAPPHEYQMLVCCPTQSAVVSARTPGISSLPPRVAAFCSAAEGQSGR